MNTRSTVSSHEQAQKNSTSLLGKKKTCVQFIALFLFIALVGIGCSDDKQSSGTFVPECVLDSDCDPGFICFADECFEPHTTPDATSDRGPEADDFAICGTQGDPLYCGEGEACCGSDPAVSACEDILSNPQHCGGCGNECSETEQCIGGTCICTGTLGNEVCSIDDLCCPVSDSAGEGVTNICVYLQEDAQHCGACGLTCTSRNSARNTKSEICDGGQCVCDPQDDNPQSCRVGTGCCSIDIEGDRSNCIDLSSGIRGLTEEGEEVFEHCGTCGRSCGVGETCEGGLCKCGNNNSAIYGEEGEMACPSAAEECCLNETGNDFACVPKTSGRCSCGDDKCYAGQECCGVRDINTDEVSLKCIIPTGDPNNCGGCGLNVNLDDITIIGFNPEYMCEPGKRCFEDASFEPGGENPSGVFVGVCKLNCPVNQLKCFDEDSGDEICVDPTGDLRFCGADLDGSCDLGLRIQNPIDLLDPNFPGIACEQGKICRPATTVEQGAGAPIGVCDDSCTSSSALVEIVQYQVPGDPTCKAPSCDLGNTGAWEVVDLNADGNPDTHCSNPQTSLNFCGATPIDPNLALPAYSLTEQSSNPDAGRNCQDLPNIEVTQCSNGICKVLGCLSGFSDCNNHAPDGCETSLTTDSSNCGGCGVVCGLGTTCTEIGETSECL